MSSTRALLLGALLVFTSCSLVGSHDIGDEDSCSRLLSYIAFVTTNVKSINCESLDIIIGNIFEDCDLDDDEVASLLAVKKLFEVWEDKDCKDDEEFFCSDEMECLEDLFDKNGIDCGDDEEELEDAIDCLKDLEDDSECTYLDKLRDILDADEDDICDAEDDDGHDDIGKSEEDDDSKPGRRRGRRRNQGRGRRLVAPFVIQ